MMEKKYKIGMYGGKFMPFHKGHKYCLSTAADECDTVYAIMFYNGTDEIDILKENNAEYLSLEERTKQLYRACRLLGSKAHVIPVLIDVAECKLPDGSEDWDAETPLVRAVCGDRLDAVYSSEESYGKYFSEAYPEAVHRLVDPPRITFPISGTAIRDMENVTDRESWMV